MIDELLLNEPDWSLPPDLTTGPDIFVRPLKWDRSVAVLPRETFYSYGPFDTHLRKNHRHSYGEHLWEYSWKNIVDRASPRRLNLKASAKRAIKAAVAKAFRLWHRLQSLDPSLAEKRDIHSQTCYPVVADLVLKTSHGFSVLLDGRSTQRTPSILFGDDHERREDAFTTKVLRGGDWAISVDSGQSFCLLAAQSVRSFGRVFAYEPDARGLLRLSESAVMNQMHDRIVIRPAAVGDFVGRARPSCNSAIPTEAWIDEEGHVDAAFVADPTFGLANSTPTDVPCVTLDHDFPIDLPIKLLKIDAEGSEASILRGARRLLENRCIDFVLIKVMHAAAKHRWRRELGGDRWNKLLQQLRLLTAFNYVPCALARDGSIIEYQSITIALDKSEGCHLVFMAKDQYTTGYQGGSRHDNKSTQS